MYKDTLVAVCAMVVFSMPFWGIPAVWADMLHFGTGVVLALLALAYRFEHRRASRRAEDLPHVDRRPYPQAEEEFSSEQQV